MCPGSATSTRAKSHRQPPPQGAAGPDAGSSPQEAPRHAQVPRECGRPPSEATIEDRGRRPTTRHRSHRICRIPLPCLTAERSDHPDRDTFRCPADAGCCGGPDRRQDVRTGPLRLARVAEWQTRWTQNPLCEKMYGYDSRPGRAVVNSRPGYRYFPRRTCRCRGVTLVPRTSTDIGRPRRDAHRRRSRPPHVRTPLGSGPGHHRRDPLDVHEAPRLDRPGRPEPGHRGANSDRDHLEPPHGRRTVSGSPPHSPARSWPVPSTATTQLRHRPGRGPRSAPATRPGACCSSRTCRSSWSWRRRSS